MENKITIKIKKDQPYFLVMLEAPSGVDLLIILLSRLTVAATPMSSCWCCFALKLLWWSPIRHSWRNSSSERLELRRALTSLLTTFISKTGGSSSSKIIMTYFYFSTWWGLEYPLQNLDSAEAKSNGYSFYLLFWVSCWSLCIWHLEHCT